MNLAKKGTALIAGAAFSVAIAITILFGLTLSAYGAEGTETTPEFFCEYYDSTGSQVDGNQLSDGTYDVGFYIKGFNQASVLEVTANYDPSVVTVGGVTNTTSSMTSMGTVTDNGDLVFGFVSGGTPVSVNADGEYIITVSMTVSTESTGKDVIDAADYITVSENPNLTFVVEDTSTGNYDDEYALVNNDESYQGSLSLMSCDITPVLEATGYDISGRIMIASDADGTASAFGAYKLAVDVIDSSGVTTAYGVTTNENGEYTLTGIPAGIYTLYIHGDTASVYGDTTTNRSVTLNVDGKKTVDDVGIVICDYNNDTHITGADLTQFLTYYKNYSDNGSYFVYADFNKDESITGADLTALLNLYGKTVDYPDVTL